MSFIRQSELDEEQNAHVRYAVLLIHEGGPRELSMSSILSYMSERFSAPRLTGSVPRLVWYPILYGFVLPFSYRRVRALYQSSWISAKPVRRPSGSVVIPQPGATPAVYYTNRLAQNLAAAITDMINAMRGEDEPISTPWTRRGSSVSQTSVSGRGLGAGNGGSAGTVPLLTYSVQVEVAYTCQSHSVDDALARFRLHGNYSGVRDTAKRPAKVLDERLIVLPLHPQYSSLATGSAFDAVMCSSYFRRCVCFPHMNFVRSYCDHHAYVKAMECAVRAFLAQNPEPDLLVVVFDNRPSTYGGPKDCYVADCQRTFMALREVLAGPQLFSVPGSWSPQPTFNDPLSADAIAMSYINVSPASERNASEDVYVLLKEASRRYQRAEPEPAQLTEQDGHQDRKEVEEETRAESRTVTGSDAVTSLCNTSSAGVVYFVFPGVSVETAESIVESRRLCDYAVSNGWCVAKVVPSLNGSSAHVEMLCSVLSSEM